MTTFTPMATCDNIVAPNDKFDMATPVFRKTEYVSVIPHGQLSTTLLLPEDDSDDDDVLLQTPHDGAITAPTMRLTMRVTTTDDNRYGTSRGVPTIPCASTLPSPLAAKHHVHPWWDESDAGLTNRSIVWYTTPNEYQEADHGTNKRFWEDIDRHLKEDDGSRNDAGDTGADGKATGHPLKLRPKRRRCSVPDDLQG